MMMMMILSISIVVMDASTTSRLIRIRISTSNIQLLFFGTALVHAIFHVLIFVVVVVFVVLFLLITSLPGIVILISVSLLSVDVCHDRRTIFVPSPPPSSPPPPPPLSPRRVVRQRPSSKLSNITNLFLSPSNGALSFRPLYYDLVFIAMYRFSISTNHTWGFIYIFHSYPSCWRVCRRVPYYLVIKDW